MKPLLILTLLLAGCSTSVPVKRTFPAVPEVLLQECPDLKLLKDDTSKLSEVLTVVNENYGQYKECQIKVEQWREWYTKQKKIFDEVK